ERQCRLEALLEGLAAFRSHESVRVVPLGKKEEADLASLTRLRQGVLQRAPRGGTAGTVAVESKHHLAHQAKDAAEMLGRGRRTECRNRIGDARLMQTNRVHVAFDNQQTFQVGTGMPGLVEPVELAPLVEKNRLRGVEIFRLPTVDDAAA